MSREKTKTYTAVNQRPIFPVSALILQAIKSFRSLKDINIEISTGKSERCFLKIAGKIES
jgi:serine/threonine-protein kinase RIO1